MGDIEYFIVYDFWRIFWLLVFMFGYFGEFGEWCLNYKISRLDDIYNKYDYFEERKEVYIKVLEILSFFL